MASIRVRPGVPGDVRVIAKLIRDLARYERLAHECHVSPARLRRHGFGRRRYFETLIATREGNPVGFALYFFAYSTFAAKPTLYLEDLFVPASERRSGIGEALMQALARIALRHGCSRMGWAVLDWNAPAIAFYRKLGARLYKNWIPTIIEGAPLRRLAQRAPARSAASLAKRS